MENNSKGSICIKYLEGNVNFIYLFIHFMRTLCLVSTIKPCYVFASSQKKAVFIDQFLSISGIENNKKWKLLSLCNLKSTKTFNKSRKYILESQRLCLYYRSLSSKAVTWRRIQGHHASPGTLRNNIILGYIKSSRISPFWQLITQL